MFGILITWLQTAPYRYSVVYHLAFLVACAIAAIVALTSLSRYSQRNRYAQNALLVFIFAAAAFSLVYWR